MIISNIDGYKKFSHKLISVECDGKLTEDCIKIWVAKLSEIAVKRKRKKCDKDYCTKCSSVVNQVGNKSHFFKYNKNNFYFQNIDSEDKAYFLGWIASDGHVRRKRFTIKLSDKDYYILKTFSEMLNSNIPIHHKKYEDKMWAILDVNSQILSKDICKQLFIDFGPKDYTVNMPSLNDDLTWHFLRGLFEGDGSVTNTTDKSKRLKITIASVSVNMKNAINNFIIKYDIKSSIYNKCLAIHGLNAIKFIDKIYENSNEKLCLIRKKNICDSWRGWKPKTKKLSITQAKQIRNDYLILNKKINEIATTYNVGKNTIYNIINNISYKE